MSTYNVRIFGHKGVTRLRIDDGQQGGTDSALVLQQPYVWGAALTLTVGGGALSSSVAHPTGYTNDPTTLLRIEIPNGQEIGYEVNEANRTVTATSASPRMSVSGNIQFGPGWTLSIIDMTGVA